MLHLVCVAPFKIFYKEEFHRIILSSFFHAGMSNIFLHIIEISKTKLIIIDAWHLYYNMASFLWKGKDLEQRIGSIKMLFIILISAFGSPILYTIIALLWDQYNYDNISHSCAVGFSAVLFTLKVILFAGQNTYTNYWGFRIPVKYLAWFELFLISIINPNASFIGHLCGILIGTLYVMGLFKPLFMILDYIPAINWNGNQFYEQNYNNNYQRNNYRQNNNRNNNNRRRNLRPNDLFENPHLFFN